MPIVFDQINQYFDTPETGEKFVQKINTILSTHSAESAWQKISKKILTPELPFELHRFLFSVCYPDWRESPHQAAAWIADKETIKLSNLAKCMQETGNLSVKKFHEWSIKNRDDFWRLMITNLGIKFSVKPSEIYDLSSGIENPQWLVNAKFNIIDSCFKADPDKTSIIQQKKQGVLQRFSYGELDKLSNQVANSLIKKGFIPGDALAIDMTMNFYAIAIYLGIIKMGGVVVSIADSFSSKEIASRLRIANAKGIFTQDVILRDEKIISLYEKVAEANPPLVIVLSSENKLKNSLRPEDSTWEDFLVKNENFHSYACDPQTACNILFSSGTTDNPKAIPWTHTTAIKAGVDAYLHQDIHEKDILAWPTNLGWMMGPWLIFAGLLNNATIALYEDVPRDRDFGKFIQDAGVTMLGVVPTLVASWRQTHCMQKLDWSKIKCFSSTGECSNPEDMLYLMSLASYKPIIEYCGGTEIGGAYLTSTLLENNYPSVFTTPAMGLDFVLLDEEGKLTDNGEVALLPPSIGLSLSLLNADHHEIYFANMPRMPDGKILRRHGDQAIRLSPERYCVLGRVDDTMNLGGIKVSSAEIERALANTENIIETAAVAVTLDHYGPSCLVIFAATRENLDKNVIKKMMQKKINQNLNPLFKIHDVVLVKELPKTASNKIMRRILRKEY
ncbi:MAG TPA: AMP-binding protein [Gammaproteobacteria bacterium]|nr:AMP-binding protein [Gammaproteobacteria bacterium]